MGIGKYFVLVPVDQRIFTHFHVRICHVSLDLYGVISCGIRIADSNVIGHVSFRTNSDAVVQSKCDFDLVA